MKEVLYLVKCWPLNDVGMCETSHINSNTQNVNPHWNHRMQQPLCMILSPLCIFTEQCTSVMCVPLLHFLLIDLHHAEQEADRNLHVCLCLRRQQRDRFLLGLSAAGVESACRGHSAGVGSRPPSGCAHREKEPISLNIWLYLCAPKWIWLCYSLPTFRTLCFSRHVFLITPCCFAERSKCSGGYFSCAPTPDQYPVPIF